MVLAFLALIQETAEAAQHAAGETTAVAEHEPAVVEWVNHVFGPAVLQVERAILPPIYSLFGAQWHEPAHGELIIPEHVVWAVILVGICIVGVLLMRGKSSVDRPSNGQQLLEIIVEDHDSLQCKILFKVNGSYLRDSNNNKIIHYVLYASATEMQVGAGVKNGSANLETLNVDWIYCSQKKTN